MPLQHSQFDFGTEDQLHAQPEQLNAEPEALLPNPFPFDSRWGVVYRVTPQDLHEVSMSGDVETLLYYPYNSTLSAVMATFIPRPLGFDYAKVRPLA